MVIATPIMAQYFEEIRAETKRAYAVAEQARKCGFDPELRVDVPLAANMAERVVGLISLVAPQLAHSTLTKRIKELEEEYALLDWRVALKIAEEVARERFCTFKNREEAMDVGIRVGFAYLTLGIVAAPLEGFIGLKLKKRKDGGDYLAVYYAGPVRGAGGTAAATSVILADYIRTVMGIGQYDPTKEEVERFIIEIHDYHERVTNLQYHPSDKEIRFLAEHIPVEINGDPTEEITVSRNKDLERVETNAIRGGMCLVLAEGIAQKSPKLWKRMSEWGANFNLKWDFLAEFLELQKSVKAGENLKPMQEGVPPNYTYISDIVAGRPILTHPMRNGGFRLRYGRTPISGFSAVSLHPTTLDVLNNYIATGTQLKVERPGKAATITPCDSIEGPIVKLKNGSVVKLSDMKDPKKIVADIEEIIYLGDMLISYGDFSENGHKLVPAGYCEEWWIREVEKAAVSLFGNLDEEKLSAYLELDRDIVSAIISNPLSIKPSFACAELFSTKLNIPMHPAFTYFWATITVEDLDALIDWMASARFDFNEKYITKIILPLSPKHQRAKRALELLGLPHEVVSSEFIVIKGDEASCLGSSLKLDDLSKIKKLAGNGHGNGKAAVLNIINMLAHFTVRDKCGTFIGARMGRPEKAKMRKLSGSPHLLFPVGEEGDRLRSFQSALKNGKIESDFPLFYCKKCEMEIIYPVCDFCKYPSMKMYSCADCGMDDKESCKHGKKKPYKRRALDIHTYFNRAIENLGLSTYPDLIKGVRGTSNKDHVVEHIAKGILRAKHNVFVNKDGTTRYDMTELPITHFRPKDIKTPLSRLRELGYTTDVFGKSLEQTNQILEIKPQDIILPLNENSLDESSKKVLYRVSKFIDDLLEKFYGQNRYYNLEKEDDLVGHLVIGLAPHISAGLIGRVIGFSDTQGCFAHPLWHAGLRRDCDGDECCVMLLMDALLNFSRQYLPDQRGAKTMDSPLVLTSQLIPSEVDDQSHGLDIQWWYPLQLYEAALNYQNPRDVKIEQIKHRLETERQYEQFGFTHSVSNMNGGVKCSAYKTIPTMGEKLRGQIEIAKRIRAVDVDDVARLVIEKHFIKDIKGNLRRFSMQQFRCIQCGEKFRRPPLIGRCTACSGKLIFTVSEGSITKYLQPCINLATEFNLPVYLVQTIEILRRRIESVFGKEKEKQSGLGSWTT
ncbi:DNA polymerase II large subunit [Candidatus Woesearchaeota archaeon]|nr:DNA polymerase II large subunit [Candidatus Woesearchaeota archaeon]